MNNTDPFLWVSNLCFCWKLDTSKLCYMEIFKCRSISPSVFTGICCSHVFVLFLVLLLLLRLILTIDIRDNLSVHGGGVAHICRCAYLYAHEGYSMTKYFHLWLYTHHFNAGSLNRKLPILVRLPRQWAFRFCLSQSLNAMIMGIYAAMPKLFFLIHAWN